MAYDANGAAGPHNPPEGRFAWCPENERQRIREELAGADWDGKTDDVQEWLTDNATDYINDLAAGGDRGAAALARMRRDCLAYLVGTMDEDRVDDALAGDAVTAAEAASGL